MSLLKSILYFILAGLFEIGGGYLIWLWLREGKNFWICNNRCYCTSILWYYPHITTCKY
ncbi:hypothetical protein [Sporocytophaga sp.]|uniref:hypothetical protein n=1 Tax=Sporocytophaga sp. TaxID=2231183 RepID=UPI0025DAAFF1|nr:hypothetical protein [Sporocytophaga sp.]